MFVLFLFYREGRRSSGLDASFWSFLSITTNPPRLVWHMLAMPRLPWSRYAWHNTNISGPPYLNYIENLQCKLMASFSVADTMSSSHPDNSDDNYYNNENADNNTNYNNDDANNDNNKNIHNDKKQKNNNDHNMNVSHHFTGNKPSVQSDLPSVCGVYH